MKGAVTRVNAVTMKDAATSASGVANPVVTTAGGGEAQRLSARERLLRAANELFYEEGVHTVGIDRVIERAGVAKATLYSAFGSKDELIRAYLTAWAKARQERITRALQQVDTPRESLLAIFDLLSESTSKRDYRGCAFMNASAEAPDDSPIVEVSDEYRGWMRSLFTRLSGEAGADDPQWLGRQLHLLYDGASVSARMDHDPKAAAAARAMAEKLIDAAV